ncbi:MAG: cation-translocating P-type ATPase, partial [Methylobacter sp.]
VVTTILSRGTRLLADANAIVKRLRSTETLGATSAICSDKTGTLTLNQMTAVELTIPGRRYTVSGGGYSTEGAITHVYGEPEIPLEPFALPLVLACDAVLTPTGEMIGDPTEGALVVLGAKAGLDITATRERYPRVAELPFDTAYKLMATFHRMPDESGREVVRGFVKGAPDQLLARASTHLNPALATAPTNADFKARYLAENERLGKKGLRVMATARKDFDAAGFDPAADMLDLMQDLTLMALVGIVDPPRPAAKAAIATAHDAGIQVRMITGDHAVTAEAIARDLGIEGRAISGAQFAELSDPEAEEQIDEIGVIARVTPEQKVRLVDILKRRGHVVAMTGDGVNDAPALKSADIGIAMGVTGTDVAKEAAAMVLTDDNFATIVKAVKEGRGIYDNMVKFVRFQLSTNIGAILTVAGAPLLDMPAPFTAVELLWINIIMDGPPAMSLGVDPVRAASMDEAPRNADARILSLRRFGNLFTYGLIMAAGTLGVLYYGLQTDPNHAPTLAFTTFVLFQVFNVFNARSEKGTTFNGHFYANRLLWLALSGVVLLQIVVIYWSPAQQIFRTAALTSLEWLIAVGVASTVLVFEEMRKLLR